MNITIYGLRPTSTVLIMHRPGEDSLIRVRERGYLQWETTFDSYADVVNIEPNLVRDTNYKSSSLVTAVPKTVASKEEIERTLLDDIVCNPEINSLDPIPIQETPPEPSEPLGDSSASSEPEQLFLPHLGPNQDVES